MKQPRKLEIKKVTLRDLDDSELDEVAGAGPSNEFTACATCFSCVTRCGTCFHCP